MEREQGRKQDRVEAAIRIRGCAWPLLNGEKVEDQIARAAAHLNWPVRRVRAIWFGEARIDAWEMDVLRNCPPPT